jgi:hypothetical protein
MKRRLLEFLSEVGLLDEVPAEDPGRGVVLARGVCFLHDGADNPNAFLLYADGFVCTTNGCHHTWEFGHNLEGLIRLMVHRVCGRTLNWRDAWGYAQENKDRLRELVDGRTRAAQGGGGRRGRVPYTLGDLAACLAVPDAYYLGRGYQPETLRHFGVGTGVRPLPDGNRLLGWAVFPVVDSLGDLVGYTARDPRWAKGGPGGKWHHALSRGEHLFNRRNAAHSLGRTNVVVLCEGPGDVMRFHEAGYPSAVAVLGSSLSEGQFYGLHGLLARGCKLYVAADNDEAGRKFAAQAYAKVRGPFDASVIFPPRGKDFGELDPAEIRALGLHSGRRLACS